MKRNVFKCYVLLTLIVLLVCGVTLGSAARCWWLFEAHEGVLSKNSLLTDTIQKQCPGFLSYAVSNANYNDAYFVHPHDPHLYMLPAVTDMNSDTVRYTSVMVDVLCNGTTYICDNAPVMYVIRPEEVAPTLPPTLPSCSEVAPFQVTAGEPLKGVLSPSDADKALCKQSGSAFFEYSAVSKPTWDKDFSFTSLNNEGHFDYRAPSNISAAEDDQFPFVLSCGSPGNSVGICQGNVTIAISPPQTEPTDPLEECPGVFDYIYETQGETAVPIGETNLFQRASIKQNGFCVDGNYIEAVPLSPPLGQLFSIDAGTGVFSYQPRSVSELEDSFNFSLTCADGKKCQGRADIAVVASPNQSSTHYLHDSTIVCRGTCLASNSSTFVRADQKDVGTVEFSFSSQGELKITAFGAIDGLEAHFVTFNPITDSDAPLNSSKLLDNRMFSFDSTCLDKQESYGFIEQLWTVAGEGNWLGEVNNATENYILGENYFQKFNGHHRYCDVFRKDPCQLAPFYTPEAPSLFQDGDLPNPVSWKVYINNCDATWVGTATMDSLRAMVRADGAPVFSLVNGTELVGTVYFQTVSPSSFSGSEQLINVTQKAYNLVISLENNIVVEAHQVPPSPGTQSFHLGSDVQYTAGVDGATHERLYAYALLLYPFQVNGNSEDNFTVAHVSTSDYKIKSIHLLNFTWISPNSIECPQCTGKRTTCIGTGEGLQTDCGASEGIVTLEWILPNSHIFDENYLEPQGGVDVLFPSTSFTNQSYYNISLVARANGSGSGLSADKAPAGIFFLELEFSNKQKFVVSVNQTDYISQINTHYLKPFLCRSTAYWPVPDSFGTSLPIHPYQLESSTNSSTNPVPGGTSTSTFPYPTLLSTREQCANSFPSGSSTVTVNDLSAVVVDGNHSYEASMCAMRDERTYGINDWMMLSISDLDELAQKVRDGMIEEQIKEYSAGDTTVSVDLDYLVLSAHSFDTLPGSFYESSTASPRVRVLLDGLHSIERPISDEARFMSIDDTEPVLNETIYNWRDYASFLSYRRIHVDKGSVETDELSAANSFHFSFIPGSLLHSTSRVRTTMSLEASFRFSLYTKEGATDTSAERVVRLATRTEQLRYYFSISRAVSASIRLDTEIYSPPMDIVVTNGIARGTASTLLILLLLALLAVLGASAYIELTYRKKIKIAKRSTTIEYAAGAAPSDSDLSEERSHDSDDEVCARIQTSFGMVRNEQVRIEDRVTESSSTVVRKEKAKERRPPEPRKKNAETSAIHEEPSRVKDNEVAELIQEEQVRVEDHEVAEF